MLRKAAAGFALLGLVHGPAFAESLTFNLKAVVPMTCQVRHQPVAASPAPAGQVNLGEIDEYCNSASGYELVVSYTPGTLQGTVLTAGEDRVVLNGSGEATLSRVPGARIRERTLLATPGANGFDADRLEVNIRPI